MPPSLNQPNIELLVTDYPIIRAYLSPSAHELITVCGIDAAFKLINLCGGENIPIGKNYNVFGKLLFKQLADLVGDDAALRLTLSYGSSQRTIYIPKCDNAKRYIRNRRIVARFDELTKTQTATKAVSILAAEFGTTERNIWRLLKG